MSDEKNEQDMVVVRSGSRPPMPGPADWFTGEVYIEGMMHAPQPNPSRVGVAVVRFEPGARTNWHNHPLGQILYVTEGVGWTQCEGGPKTEIRPGDFIWCNCGRRHWHGATATSGMTHVAVNEALNGSPVDWFEAVTDEDYLAEDVVTD